MPGANLLCIYQDQSIHETPQGVQSCATRLPITPLWTNRLGWQKGYFETPDDRPPSYPEVVRHHGYFHAVGKYYADETGKRIPKRIEPFGSWGLVSYRRIDDKISDAVGIDRFPEA